MTITNELTANPHPFQGWSSSTVQLFREGVVGVVRTSAICTKQTDHGFEAEVAAVLRVGEEVQAELSLPESVEPVRVSARVIYRNENHYGFFFRSVPSGRGLGIAAKSPTPLIQ